MPGAAAAIEKLDPKIRANAGTIQDYINRTRDAAYKTTQQEYKQRALGLSTNDVEKFVSTDFTTWPLNRVDLTEIQNRQAKLVKNAQDDPRVMHAQSWMRGAMGTQLQALGIYSRNANNTDDYDHYTGALQEAIQEFQEEHKHAPTYKDVIEHIGPQVINTQTEHKGWLWNSQEPAFEQWTRPQPNEVPPEFRQQITKEVIDKGGVVPSEDQLYRAYIRSQFNKLYGSKGTPSAGPTPAKSQ
jgi:type II secretory pathway pseudopilin PulG